MVGALSLRVKRRIGCSTSSPSPSPSAFSTFGVPVRPGCAGCRAACSGLPSSGSCCRQRCARTPRGLRSRPGWLAWACPACSSGRCWRSRPGAPGVTQPLTLLIASAGSALVLHYGHSLKLTQLAGALAAALLPILLRSACRPSPVMATAPVMVLLPGLWLTSSFYDYTPPPPSSWLLLAAAAMAASFGLLPGVRKMTPWQRGLVCGLAASLLVAWAVSSVQSVRKKDESLLLSPSRTQGATIEEQVHVDPFPLPRGRRWRQGWVRSW